MMRYNKLVYIKEKVDNNTYIVIEHDTHKQIDHPVHSDRLKKYYNERDMFPTRIERGEEMSESDEEENEIKGKKTKQKQKREIRSKEIRKTQDRVAKNTDEE